MIQHHLFMYCKSKYFEILNVQFILKIRPYFNDLNSQGRGNLNVMKKREISHNVLNSV